ncbi:MAG: MaoC family dehydratase N-terminal domain-containing protein [Deltaproteobacteria bacterium]|nr:MaoC family dehydratase N-terminal domain-containing protein [Deltaproteobacteria bacterium]
MQTGITFEGFKQGDRFTTARRTITESEVMQFVCLVGLFEPLFVDLEYIREESLYGERIAPGSLTFGMAEGLTVQTGIIHGTGMAFVGLERMRLFAPVKVGDTIQVEIEVLDRKEVKSKGGGIVRFLQKVNNQRGETVIEYEVSRLIRGEGEKSRQEKNA